MIAEKAFVQPQHFRNKLLDAKLITGDKTHFSGKTFICVSLTRFCPVGCKFCFFKSGNAFRHPTREDLLTEEGMDKFVAFSNDINLGYMLVSGGGEPMMEKKSTLKIIEEVQSERIVLVTSAHWARKEEGARRYLEAIKERLAKRKTETLVTVRVSVDTEHSATLTFDPIINLLKLFKENYRDVPQLELQIHSLDGDPAIDDVLKRVESDYKISRQVVDQERISDGKNAVKIVPKQEIISFDDMDIKVGYAKAFYSDLRVNIHARDDIQKNIDVYQKDLFESEDGNSSIVTNKLGEPGLDFWVNYNGNVTTWGNQYLDNLFNLYTDSSEDIISGSLSDPAALSFIEKGATYRDAVIAEANETAVIRSKAVNIRDYTGALMFDEERTRLYYTIRALQDFIKEGRISEEKLDTLPQELRNLLAVSREDLVNSYTATKHTIVQQTIDAGFNSGHILDILEWIKLGHYKVSDADIQRLVNFYNENVAEADKIEGLHSLNHQLKMQVVRMTEHLTHIKAEAKEEVIEEEKVAA